MRTLLFVAAMVAIAVAAGLSFVLPAAAQEPASAELEFGCGEKIVVASFEPTLLTCTAQARNTGSTALQSAQLEFLRAANVPPPNFYMFWSETRDGVRSIPGPVDTIFDLVPLQLDAYALSERAEARRWMLEAGNRASSRLMVSSSCTGTR